MKLLKVLFLSDDEIERLRGPAVGGGRGGGGGGAGGEGAGGDGKLGKGKSSRQHGVVNEGIAGRRKDDTEKRANKTTTSATVQLGATTTTTTTTKRATTTAAASLPTLMPVILPNKAIYATTSWGSQVNGTRTKSGEKGDVLY